MKMTQIQSHPTNPNFEIPPTQKVVENRHWRSRAHVGNAPSCSNRQPLLSLRGAECLERILSDIHAKLKLNEDCAIFLYVIDDIDFDCGQPFLARVLEELVTNAVSAAGKRAVGRIDVLATQFNGRLFMQVADNGLGIPDDMVCWFEGRLQEPAQLGEGSGLDKAALLIKQAGGQLSLVNSGRTGTRLGFSLPLHDTLRDAGYRCD